MDDATSSSRAAHEGAAPLQNGNGTQQSQEGSAVGMSESQSTVLADHSALASTAATAPHTVDQPAASNGIAPPAAMKHAEPSQASVVPAEPQQQGEPDSAQDLDRVGSSIGPTAEVTMEEQATKDTVQNPTGDTPAVPARTTAELAAETVDSDSVMVSSEAPSRAPSPTPRESTPALSEAPSDTPSVDSNLAGPPPEAAGVDLSHPLSAYQFANTTLVPVASTSTNPFHFVSWPPQPLEDSWQRTRLPDDDEAYLELDREPGYRASPAELEASRVREAEKQAKIKAKLLQSKGKGKAKEVVVRAAPKARAMERANSTDQPVPAKRGRPAKSTLQQTVVRPTRPEVQAAPQAAPPLKPVKRSQLVIQRSQFARDLAGRELLSPLTFPHFDLGIHRPDVILYAVLMRDGLQVALPGGTKPHPDFIDLYALPPHYLAEEGAPPNSAEASQNPAPGTQPPAAASASAVTSNAPSRSASATVASDPAATTPQPTDPKVASNESKAVKRVREQTDEGTGNPKKTKRMAQPAEAKPETDAPTPEQVAPPVDYMLQQTTCLSKKIDGQIRCCQCIARAIGQGCCFQGIRSFGVNAEAQIVTPPVFLDTKLPDDVPQFTKQLIAPISDQYNQLMRTWLAPQLLPIVERERKHAEDAGTKRLRLDLTTLSLCDTCNTSILGSEWMCSTCGRVACRTCYQTLSDLEQREAAGLQPLVTQNEAQRRKKCIAKKRGGDKASSGEDHCTEQFVPMSRLDKRDLAQLQADLYKWKITHAIVPSDGSAKKFLDETYLLESPLPDYDQNTHPLHHIPACDMNPAVFLELWLSSAPILVTDINLGALTKWTPSYIANRFPLMEVQLQNNKGSELLTATVPYFFGQFNEDGGPQRTEDVKQTFRTKDFPGPRQFTRDFKELAEEFYRILPIRDLIHPDGPLNFLAHTPANAVQPDVGPSATNSWAVDAATGTTLLRTDVTDIASLMYWGHHDVATGRELRIRWDVFRSEDAEVLREFCWELLTKKLPKGTSATRFRESHDDPLLNPCVYLNQRQRDHLATTKKVFSYPVYQYPGQLVLIPAGCPYQVSSWSDHLSLTTHFLAGPRLSDALKVNGACSRETKERTLWRTDNIQLERQLLYAWYSCQNADKRYTPTPLDWKPRTNKTAEDLAREARSTEKPASIKPKDKEASAD
ncbi:uncharacterized protein JCM15063_006533 [Sporobolomyces koalae]|uniref:uncharacterized protein n=1 Tax=Sporobolomyces koalae TaxID=500713 RepID=UPI0031826C26